MTNKFNYLQERFPKAINNRNVIKFNVLNSLMKS